MKKYRPFLLTIFSFVMLQSSAFAGNNHKYYQVSLVLAGNATCANDGFEASCEHIRTLEAKNAKTATDQFNNLCQKLPEIRVQCTCVKPNSRYSSGKVKTTPEVADLELVETHENASTKPTQKFALIDSCL